MKQFALKESTAIHVNAADFGPRKSGKRKVPSVRLGVGMLVANTVLDQLWPGLRGQMYEAADADIPGELPGVEPLSDTPKLRFSNLKAIRTKDELTGYLATIDIGLGRKESLVELTGCTLDKFEADLRPGGEVALRFRISSEGLNERAIGKLGSLVDCDTALMLTPPAIQDPLTGVDAVPGTEPAHNGADVAEDARTRKAGGESRVSKVTRKVNAAAKKAAARKAKP